MGMDVYGKKPKGEKGDYFRNNVWWWRPLWQYCASSAPELIDEEHLPQEQLMKVQDLMQLMLLS